MGQLDKQFDQLATLALYCGGTLQTAGTSLSDIFSRIEHSRTADEVVEQIESLILEGVLRPATGCPASANCRGSSTCRGRSCAMR